MLNYAQIAEPGYQNYVLNLVLKTSIYLQQFSYTIQCCSLTNVSIFFRDNKMIFYPCLVHIYTLSTRLSSLYKLCVYLVLLNYSSFPRAFSFSPLHIVCKRDHISQVFITLDTIILYYFPCF